MLGQVDRKFVACVLPASGSEQVGSADITEECDTGVLVLIDQHAADERIRVERFRHAIILDLFNF